MPSDPELLVLQAVRRAAVSELDGLARRASRPASEVEVVLDDLAARGLVRHRSGIPGGWSLTAAGRAEGERLVAEELVAQGARPATEAAYRSFRDLNGPLLELCTRWQLREVDGARVTNDHLDIDYDAAVIAELGAIDARVQPVLIGLAGALDRFGNYGADLANALQRVLAGEGDWFTKPTIDSYHTVWFELHEDLLSTLGIERGAEQSA